MSRWVDADELRSELIKGHDLVGAKYVDLAPTIEPCEDAISREEAIKQIVNTPIRNQDKGQEYLEGSATRQNEIIDILNDIPFVAPSRPSGEWVEAVYEGQPYNVYGVMYKCSECGYVPMYMGEPIIPTTATLLFCPNCGAKMKGADNEYDK